MKVVAVKMDEKMVAALARQARTEFSSVSGIVKKSVSRYLAENGLDWESTALPAPQKKKKPVKRTNS